MNTITSVISESMTNSLFLLPDNEKIDLARRLLESISHKTDRAIKAQSPFAALSGAWKDERSVEEVIKDMRAHRTFTHNMDEASPACEAGFVKKGHIG